MQVQLDRVGRVRRERDEREHEQLSRDHLLLAPCSCARVGDGVRLTTKTMSSGDESQVSMHSVEIVAPRSAAQQEQRAQEGQYTDTDDDEEEAWDEVEIAEQQRDAPAPASTSTSTSTPRESFEITLDKSADGTGKGNGKGNRAKGKGKGISIQERRARQQLHRAHAACLLASGAIRNSWLNDPLLQVRLDAREPFESQLTHTHTDPVTGAPALARAAQAPERVPHVLAKVAPGPERALEAL